MQRRIQPPPPVAKQAAPPNPRETFKITRQGAFLDIETPCQRLRLNCRRGLTIHGWWDKALSSLPLVGTLPHGYFDDIQLGADYYTGHFVLETAGRHKITDLSPVQPDWQVDNDDLLVRAEIPTPLGTVVKTVRVSGGEASLEIRYQFRWPSCPLGTLRLGHVTINPEAFQDRHLFFRTHNGGDSPETFRLDGGAVNHLSPVSTLVSANNALGITAGYADLGDDRQWVRIAVDQTAAALLGHIIYTPVENNYLYRLVLSAMETDDTACRVDTRRCFNNREIRLSIAAGR
jgi:hypothetical protein